MRSREIRWAELPAPYGRRPVCILTREAALSVLSGVSVAPITRTARGIRSEVAVGPDEGLSAPSVITCDNVLTIRRSKLDANALGRLSPDKQRQLDRALKYALGIKG